MRPKKFQCNLLPLHARSRRLLAFCAAFLVLCLPDFTYAETFGPNLLPQGNFENVTLTYVPWAGVDDKGNIHGLDGQQLSVADDGRIGNYAFSPSVSVGDLNGDGKPDLVIADSKGFFWFFPNSGTPTTPVFTQGENIPIWLGEERVEWNTEGIDNVVPRIQLADLNDHKILDIIAGTYSGILFLIRNVGSSTDPDFRPTLHQERLIINTRRKGVLWCNYLAPCLTGLFGSPGVLDLLVGEGTYSANSIYLLRNRGSNASPSFDEDHTAKIIPGMGLEQLTPAVVDWNNDGKPDIISGDRTGYIDLYLNNSNNPSDPTFEPATHISIGGVEKFGNATTVTVGDLTGNHLPNLLIGKDDGTIVYALNTGKLGAPDFSTPAAPLKGSLPPTFHYTSPNDWSKSGAWGAPNELLACVNPQLEPGFTFPEGENSKFALKFFVWPIKNIYFPQRYYPLVEDELREHVIRCTHSFTFNLNKRYRIHGWIKVDRNLSSLRYRLTAATSDRDGFHGYDVTNPIDAGSVWTELSSEIKISNPNDRTVSTWDYGFEFRFTGQATFYIDDLQIQEEL